MIEKIVIHCSDSPHGRGDDARTIHRWHSEKPPKGKSETCLDCGTPIWRGGLRCKSCSNKSRASAEVKSCISCGSPISRKAKKWCLACWNKEQDQGKSRERTKFNASKEWARARTACFERDDYTCQHCGERGGVYLEAHHIKGYANFPDLRLEVSNLLTLCKQCHRAHHKQHGRPRKCAA